MCRCYQDLPIRASVVRRIVESGSWAPAAGNARGVHCLIVQEPQRRQRIAQLAGEPAWVAKGYPAWLSGAPVHLILFLDRRAYIERYAQMDKAASRLNGYPVDFAAFDAGAFTMAILLAAEIEGLGAGFLGGHNLPGLNQELQVPEDFEVVGLITIGHADKAIAKVGSPRSKSRAETQHWEHWE